MKRKFLLSGIVLLSVFQLANSQELAFAKGSIVAQAGVGLGGNVGLPISLSLDYGMTDKISIGAIAGFSSWNGSGVKVTYIPAGVRGAYHFYNSEKMEAYAGATLGYLVANVSGGIQGIGYGGVMYGGYAGGRYYLTPSIGAFAELGYTSLSYLTAGIAFKL